MEEQIANKQMPRYQCHKKVWALRIKSIEADNILVFEDETYGKRVMPVDYIDKHRPYGGGYFVQYEDGYCSFSPPKAFEEGYARLDGRETRCPFGTAMAGAFDAIERLPASRERSLAHTKLQEAEMWFNKAWSESRRGQGPAPKNG